MLFMFSFGLQPFGTKLLACPAVRLCVRAGFVVLLLVRYGLLECFDFRRLVLGGKWPCVSDTY